MKKNIWIINEYAGSPYHGMTYRHYYLAKELHTLGYNVTIITASYSHFLTEKPDMKARTYLTEEIEGIRYVWIKVIEYDRSFDKKRILKWFDFTLKLYKVYKYITDQPDIVYCSPTAPFCIVPANKLAKKFNAKLAFEVRDIWPLTLVEVGGFSAKHPFVLFMAWFERYAIKKADYILSNLPNYGQHIQELGFNRTFSYIPNGVKLDELKTPEPLAENVRKCIPEGKFIVGYAGKVGISNAIHFLLESAKLLDVNNNIAFVIVGDGQEKEQLKNKYADLKNVVFIESIPKKQVQSLLKYFDVCYIGLQREKIFEYGVSPNKLFDYMYSGTPVLHSISTKKDIVRLANCGISVNAEDVDAIKKGILRLFNMTPTEREALGQNGKEYVIEHHDYKKLAEKFIEVTELEKTNEL